MATMTGNAAQALLTSADWHQLLTGVHRALRPGGYFVLETRQPGRRIWEEWRRPQSPESRVVPGVGPVERQFTLTDVSLPFVSFRYTYRFMTDGAVLVSDSTLWFRDRADLENILLTYGFTTLDVRDAPDRPGLEDVFITRRAD
jgi:hypothetical protein